MARRGSHRWIKATLAIGAPLDPDQVSQSVMLQGAVCGPVPLATRTTATCSNRALRSTTLRCPLRRAAVDLAPLLRSIPLFDGLLDEDLQALAATLERRSYQAGEMVFAMGDAGSWWQASSDA